MAGKVYFVNGYQFLQMFLTVYEDREDTLVYSSGDPLLQRFLRTIMPAERIRILEDLDGFLLRFRVGDVPAMVRKILQWRWAHRGHFPKRADEVFIFNRTGQLQCYMAAERLRRRGARVRILDGAAAFLDEERLSQSELGIVSRLLLGILGWAAGVPMAVYRNRIRTFNLGWRREHEDTKPEPKPWKALLDRYPEMVGGIEVHENDVLFVDSPFQALPGVVVDATQRNLERYLCKRLPAGGRIFMKRHPRFTEYHSLSGTALDTADRLQLLPDYVPAELIMQLFHDIVLFYSTVLSVRVPARITSLFQLIVFAEDKHRLRCQGVLEGHLRDTDNRIEFANVE